MLFHCSGISQWRYVYMFIFVLPFRMDATLKELTSLVKEVNPDARRKGTFFDFAVVFPDPRTPVYRMREIGTTCAGHRGQDDGHSLTSKRFQIGDYLDIAVTPPRGGGGPPPRRNRPYWTLNSLCHVWMSRLCRCLYNDERFTLLCYFTHFTMLLCLNIT